MNRPIRSFLFVAFTTGMASSLSLIGGIGLEHVSQKILPLIPLLIAIPSLNDMVGDYSTIISAHTGDPTERSKTHKVLSKAIFRVVGLNISAIFVLSLLVGAKRGFVLDGGFALKYLGFLVVAILLVIFFMFWINKVLDHFLRQKRFNPDDLLIPICTSVADILMLGLVSAAAIFLF